ncbi:MAG TPA: hypothetical protein VFR23_02130, partial [Jiangellaceae bacterium]|nr:hypothetical protein [Jiangellaceae bacterium]
MHNEARLVRVDPIGHTLLHVRRRVGRRARAEAPGPCRHIGHPVDAEAAPVVAIEVVGEEVPAPVGGDQAVGLDPPPSHLAPGRVIEAG